LRLFYRWAGFIWHGWLVSSGICSGVIMSLGLTRLVAGIGTVVKRRGFAYFPYLAREHVPARIAYRLLRAPGHSPSALHLTQKAWSALDRLSGAASRTRLDSPPQSTDLPGQPAAGTGAIGRPVSPADVSAEFVRECERLFNSLHRQGITGLRHSLDLLVLTPGGQLAFTRLQQARAGRAHGIRFMVERDLDREAVNARFGLSLLTEAGVRLAQARLRERLPEGWFRDYAPIDFGGGVSIGMFPSTDSGTGRWDFFNGEVVAPLVRDRRVVDLGSNNGSLPLMMVRAGAREVVAVEQSPLLAEGARLNHRILQWRDMREYGLQVQVGDMREFLSAEWGRFDVVTAFCSLYYLPEADMAAVVRKAATMGATLILQANDGAVDIPAARTSSLQELMAGNGYDSVHVHTRDEFLRPLLVGTPVAVSTQPTA
jgi:SAM-dependent methyltransferase